MLDTKIEYDEKIYRVPSDVPAHLSKPPNVFFVSHIDCGICGMNFSIVSVACFGLISSLFAVGSGAVAFLLVCLDRKGQCFGILIFFHILTLFFPSHIQFIVPLENKRAMI